MALMAFVRLDSLVATAATVVGLVVVVVVVVVYAKAAVVLVVLLAIFGGIGLALRGCGGVRGVSASFPPLVLGVT
jgi:hypothetical protein